MAPNFSKIILGTVQLGMPYGLGRWREELMPESIAFSILDAAWDMGITTLDTSPDYGVAEERIAKYMKLNPSKQFHIISKVKQISQNDKLIGKSLSDWANMCPFLNLNNRKSLSVLLHKEGDVLRQGVSDAMNDLTNKQLVSSWGVSLYQRKALKEAEKIDKCSIFQIPVSLFHLSFAENGDIKKLSDCNKTVVARSIFYKGVIFTDKEEIPPNNYLALTVLNGLSESAKQSNLTLSQYALTFVSQINGIKASIIGVDEPKQLEELARIDLSNTLYPLDRRTVIGLKRLENQMLGTNKWIANPLVSGRIN